MAGHRGTGGTFQELITGSPCSVPSVLRVPVSSRNKRPSAGSRRRQVTVRDKRDIAVGEQRRHPGQHRVGPRGHLGDGLARMCRVARDDPVAPQVPAGAFGPDHRGGPPFVAAVVPLPQVGVLLHLGEPGQAGGPHGALRGAGEGRANGPGGERGGQRGGHRLTGRRQRHVGTAGVPQVAAPLGLAVPEQDQFTHEPHDDRSARYGRARPGAAIGPRAVSW